MIKSIKVRTPILALILFVFSVGHVFAQDPPKVVVIPLGGGVDEDARVHASGRKELDAPVNIGANKVVLIDIGRIRVVGRCVREGDMSRTAQIDIETTTDSGFYAAHTIFGKAEGGFLGTNDIKTLIETPDGSAVFNQATYTVEAHPSGLMLHGVVMVSEGLHGGGPCRFTASGISS